MKNTIIAIIMGAAAAAGFGLSACGDAKAACEAKDQMCWRWDENTEKCWPQLVCQGGGGDTDGTSASGGGGGGSADSADGTGTGGDACDPTTFEHQCRQMACFVRYAPNQGRTTQGTLGPDPAENPAHCAIIPEKDTSAIANSPADTFVAPMICGGPAAHTGPTPDCVEAAEDDLKPGDFGQLGHISNPNGAGTWEGKVFCIELGDNFAGWDSIGLGANAVNGAGSCDYTSGATGWDTWTQPTGAPCSTDECAMGATEADCWDYAYSSDPYTTSSGNHIYATLDWSWVQQTYGSTAPLWECDVSRYDFGTGQVHLAEGDNDSLLYRLGMRHGDSALSAWKHDSSYNRVGSIKPLGTMAQGLAAFAALVPALGKEIHVTIGFTRRGVAMQLHVDVE